MNASRARVWIYAAAVYVSLISVASAISTMLIGSFFITQFRTHADAAAP